MTRGGVSIFRGKPEDNPLSAYVGWFSELRDSFAMGSEGASVFSSNFLLRPRTIGLETIFLCPAACYAKIRLLAPSLGTTSWSKRLAPVAWERSIEPSINTWVVMLP